MIGKIFAVLLGIGSWALGIYLSSLWWVAMMGWIGDWPTIIGVAGWFFLGGIEIILIIGILGTMCAAAIWAACD